MHARLLVHNLSSYYFCYCYYFQFLILPSILFLCSTCTVTASSCSIFYCSSSFVYSCWFAYDELYYFSVSRSESQYIELIVEHILVQLFCGEFSLFSFFTCLIQILWMILFIFHYFIYVILSLLLVVYAYMCAILLVIGSLRCSWKRFHSSWVSAGHRHIPVLRILRSGA